MPVTISDGEVVVVGADATHVNAAAIVTRFFPREMVPGKPLEKCHLKAPLDTDLYGDIERLFMGAMKRGRGMCSMFQSFQLTYHAHTTFIDIYNHFWYVHIPNRPLNRPSY